jgi:diguanylate cyclase (GGDEF)-like protein
MIPHRTLVRRRFRQLLPFAFAMTVAFAFLALPPDTHQTTDLLLALGLTALVTTLAVVAPWHKLPRICQVLPAMAFLPVIMILREMEGGPGSGYAALLVLPVLWLALYSTGEAVAIAVAGVAGALVTPILIAGNPRYPASEWRWTGITVTVVAVAGYTVIRLVARSRRLSARLAELAATDPLTLIPNRRSWDEQLAREIARARRTHAPLSVALIDLDGLKAVNDDFGHLAGDALLQDCARAWKSHIRTEDFIARYGGDEFALLLPACPLDEAVVVVDRIRSGTPGTSCSVGVAEWEPGEAEIELLHRADQRLYEAKRSGGAIVVADRRSVPEPGFTSSAIGSS